MIFRSFTSQKGFSLFKILILLAIVVIGVLVFLPQGLGGDKFAVINKLSARAKSIVSGITGKIGGISDKIGGAVQGMRLKLARKLQDYSDRWNLKDLSELIAGVEEEWEGDMDKLVSISKSRGFNMSDVEQRRAQYQQGTASWKRVEREYWDEIREQTQADITKSIQRFRTRPLGCSDFTIEMRKIWDVVEKFNEDTLEGYFDAKALSLELLQPRSEQFLREFLRWLAVANIHSSSGNWSNSWLIQQLRLATTPTVDGNIPDYPAVIRQLDSQTEAYSYSIDNILKDIVVAEIFLNYDLINPAEDRFDAAIRNLAGIVAQYQHNPYSMTTLGLHMALGLLHERVCKNNDLAIKEFKDVIAIARRLGLACTDYSIAHYHLGVINLNIRADEAAQAVFEEASSGYSGSTKDLLEATPTPQPTPTPIPTATPKPPVKIDIGITIPRTLKEEERPERPVETESISPEPAPTPSSAEMGVIKGTIAPDEPRRWERDIRLRPRTELGTTVKMKKFNVNDLYDLTKIPDDAAREFELYLKCISQGDRATIARFIHQNYIEH